MFCTLEKAMRLRKKSTYTKLINAFHEYLQCNLDLPLSFNQEDRMLAYILFNLSPSEIDKKLNQNEVIPVDWKPKNKSLRKTRFQSTIWPRLTESLQEHNLTDMQLRDLMVNTLKAGILELEPSMLSMAFQSALGIQYVLVDKVNEANIETEHYLLNWYLPSGAHSLHSGGWAGLDHKRFYTPSSAKERYSAFDKQSFQIMATVCNNILLQAYQKAPQLNQQTIVYTELYKLRDHHLVLLFVREHQDLSNIILINIVEYYERESPYINKVDIKQSVSWFSALRAINFSLYSLWNIIEDEYHDFSDKNHIPAKNNVADKLYLLIMQYLFETGLTTNKHGKACGNETLVDAVSDACRSAISYLTDELVRYISLLTTGKTKEFLLELIPQDV